jgi:hypothetical protein
MILKREIAVLDRLGARTTRVDEIEHRLAELGYPQRQQARAAELQARADLAAQLAELERREKRR